MNIFLLLSIISCVNAFASWFVNEYCDRDLRAGEIIMNSEAKDSKEREVRVYRGTTLLKSGDVYYPGEKLTCELIGEDIGESLFEATVGIFEDGGCDNTRTSSLIPRMKMPVSEDITKVGIWGGWALGHSTVYISEMFVLNRAEGDSKPPPVKQPAKIKPGKAKSLDEVIGNINGAAETMKSMKDRAKMKYDGAVTATESLFGYAKDGIITIIIWVSVVVVVVIGFYNRGAILAQFKRSDKSN